MKKKSIIILIGINISLFILFLFSTNIILAFQNNSLNNLSMIEKRKYDDLLDNVIFRIDTFRENNDILFSVEFTGWATIKDSQENHDKYIKLVFISENNSYEVSTDLQDRFDIRKFIVEQNVSNLHHGFITRFSPLSMKNGVYQLHIFTYENQELMGFVDTGISFLKSHRSFEKYE